jgi:hypothetical protein
MEVIKRPNPEAILDREDRGVAIEDRQSQMQCDPKYGDENRHFPASEQSEEKRVWLSALRSLRGGQHGDQVRKK